MTVTKLRNVTISGLIARMRKRAREGRSHFQDFMRLLVYVHAARGDESFGKNAILSLYWRTVHDQLDEADRAMLALVLNRLIHSRGGVKIASGQEGRGGQKKRGWMGLQVAWDVSEAIKGGSTAEAAWIEVGKKVHLTDGAVKGHWMNWKPELLAAANLFVREKCPFLSPEQVETAGAVAVLGFRAVPHAKLEEIERLMEQHGMNQSEAWTGNV